MNNRDCQILLEDAVRLFGTKSKLARALGINRQAITKWSDGEPIPALRAMQIRYELRPEAFTKAGAIRKRL